MTQHSPGNFDFDVAIIGGGAAGVLVAINLLKASRIALRIAIIETRSGLGQGVAYSTDYREHLLNVITSRISAFPSQPGHFTEFLSSQAGYSDHASQEIPLANRFVSRVDFRRYLQATLAAQAGAEKIRWFHDEAIDMQHDTEYVIKLRSGADIHARSVVLAIGNVARGIPLPATAIQGSPAIINAWDYPAIQHIEPDADVCIIGSGLSMVDTAISLATRHHRGKITVISRHGLTPHAHAAPGPQEGNIDNLLALGLRQRFKMLRSWAAAAQTTGEPWQWTMDRIRHHVQALWKTLAPAEQKRFLRHGARFWDIHRHRIAPSVAQAIGTLQASGQLEICAGHLSSINKKDDGIHVRFRPRGEVPEKEIRADYIVNGTGMESNIARMNNPLVDAMRKRGLIVSGPHGIGIATDETGKLISADGKTSADLMTLGALRVGQLWESIAIPELRKQALQIGEYLGNRSRS